MEFFKELFALSEGLDLTLRIKRKNDNLTISVLPDGVKNIQPLIITGTPEELDMKFIDSIQAPLNDVMGIITNAEEFKEQVKKQAESENKEAKDKEKKEETKKADKKIADKKLEKASKKAAEASKPIKKDKKVEEPEEGDTAQEPPATKEQESKPQEMSLF